MKPIKIETLIKFLLGLGAVLLLMMVLYRFFTLVLYGLIALVLTYILDPLVNRLQATGMNRTLAVSLVIASVILLLFWFSRTALPVIGGQIIMLGQQLNIEEILDVTAQIEDQILKTLPFLTKGFLRDNVPYALEALFQTDNIKDTINNLVGIFTNIFWAFLVVPFATFFMLKDGSRLRRNILELIPNKYFETVLNGIEKIEKRVVTYFKSVGLQSIIIAITATIMLNFAGLNNALSVGIVAGVANIIPYFGPLIGYLLSIIVSIIETGDFSLVLYVILAIAVTQFIDIIFLQPTLFSRSANLHPIVILFVIMIGAELAGIFGMIIAVPSMAIIVITIKQILWSLDNYYVFRPAEEPK